MKKNERVSCDCIPEAMPYLIFDNQSQKPFVKKRVKALWKSLSDIKDVILNPTEDEDIKEKTPIQEPVPEENRVRQLFEKMLDMRMDQHALAIADGYRTRPLVCLCDDVCCNCFHHSNFLHNLKLHDHKELLTKMNNKDEKSTSKSEIAQEPHREENASNRSDVFNEFTLKNEEDFEGDDPHDVALDLTVIDRMKKVVCAEKTVRAPKTASAPARKVKRVVRMIKNHEPPFETKFNSVHRRVREFDPNSYKHLVREEIKKFNEMSASERRLRSVNHENISQRPPWKI